MVKEYFMLRKTKTTKNENIISFNKNSRVLQVMVGAEHFELPRNDCTIELNRKKKTQTLFKRIAIGERNRTKLGWNKRFQKRILVLDKLTGKQWKVLACRELDQSDYAIWVWKLALIKVRPLPSYRNWEIRAQFFFMITFQSHDSQVQNNKRLREDL